MSELWRKALDHGKVIAVLFLDFKKVFDSISHVVLLKKLLACGISGDFYNYIVSYLKDRKQYTVINNANSEDEHLDYGVPQGLILGPNLFSIKVGNTIDIVFKNLKSNLSKVENYSSRNLLTLHPDKCEVLILSKSRFVGPELKIQGQSINVVKDQNALV